MIIQGFDQRLNLFFGKYGLALFLAAVGMENGVKTYKLGATRVTTWSSHEF